MIYLDNAATTGKKPDSVIKAVEMSLNKLSANVARGGYKTAQDAAALVYDCRKKIKNLFNCELEQQVVFLQNCTQAINYVLKGACRKNDHIIVSSLEHNAVIRPLNKLIDFGVKADFAEVIFDDPQATVRSFERLITADTKMILCTHASNITGHVMPIKQIGELCKKKGILFAVDAAQTAGVLPINMIDMNIDYLCIAPHKGLYAPMGTGVLICRKPLPNTLIEGGTGSDSINIRQPNDLPERFESGTINLPGISGVSAGIDFVLSKGIDKIYSHEILLSRMLHDALKKLGGIIVYSPYPNISEVNCVPIVLFNIANIPSMQVAALLAENDIAVRAGLHCAPMAHKRIGTIDNGAVRVCFSVFNSPKDVATLLSIIKQKVLLKK